MRAAVFESIRVALPFGFCGCPVHCGFGGRGAVVILEATFDIQNLAVMLLYGLFFLPSARSEF